MEVYVALTWGDAAIEARKVTDGYIYYPENSPRSAYSSGGSTMGRPSGGNVDIAVPQMESIRQLRLVSSSANPHLSDFNKLMDASRVIGKEGTKEPFKWDWALIYETLEYSFYENIHRGNAEYDNSATQTSGGHVSFGKGTKSGSFERKIDCNLQ